MMTYTQFIAQHPGMFAWACDAGRDEYGRLTLDVLLYESANDRDRDTDNSLVIERATVIDDRRYR